MNSANTPLLETERLILRKFTENDLEALFNIYSNEEVNTYLPWFPLTSLEEAASLFKEKYREVYKRPYGYHYAICPKNSNLPAGYIHAGTDDSHDLGYGLLQEFWHRGFATEAARAVVAPVEERRHTLHHGHTRYQESPQRRRHETAGHALPIFL